MERVAVGTTLPIYNPDPPYHPSAAYPELPFRDVARRPNLPYATLRELFQVLGYDSEHLGTRDWNPLGHLIAPGETVLIKPNFVLSSNASGDDVFAMITHPSILRALVDYAYVALRGQGRIIIADVPQMDCEWNELMRWQRLDTIQAFYRERFRFEIEVYDLRRFALKESRELAYSDNRRPLPGDPAGSIVINLGRQSEFYGLPSENYYGADYDRSVTIQHHQGETHEYCVSRTALSADVFVSVPKMKVHKKVGVTLNLKGLVGINTDKNYLIHYRLGTPRQGGDQLPDGQPRADRLMIRVQRWLFDHALARQTKSGDRAYRAAAAIYRRLIKPLRKPAPATVLMDSGNWYGNDSAWRMTADLAKILYFADANGQLHGRPQRKMLCVVDGIVGGDNLGPLAPSGVPAGCLVVGRNPFAVDLVTTRLMGFDIHRLRQFSIMRSPKWDFGLKSETDVVVFLDGIPITGCEFFDSTWQVPIYRFRPHPGWLGQIEVCPPGTRAGMR